jgi:hypothetical protein
MVVGRVEQMVRDVRGISESATQPKATNTVARNERSFGAPAVAAQTGAFAAAAAKSVHVVPSVSPVVQQHVQACVKTHVDKFADVMERCGFSQKKIEGMRQEVTPYAVGFHTGKLPAKAC